MKLAIVWTTSLLQRFYEPKLAIYRGNVAVAEIKCISISADYALQGPNISKHALLLGDLALPIINSIKLFHRTLEIWLVPQINLYEID